MAESHGDAKGATAHTEADGGHKAPFPPFQKDTFASQLVSLLIAFVALYLIVSRIALPRVGSLIDERQKAIEGDLAAAQKLKDASDGALKAYESRSGRGAFPRAGDRHRDPRKTERGIRGRAQDAGRAADRSNSPKPRKPSRRRARRR